MSPYTSIVTKCLAMRPQMLFPVSASAGLLPSTHVRSRSQLPPCHHDLHPIPGLTLTRRRSSPHFLFLESAVEEGTTPGSGFCDDPLQVACLPPPAVSLTVIL